MMRYIYIIVALLLSFIGVRAQPVEINFGSPVLSDCRIVAIPVTVRNFSNIGAISLKLNFDKAMLEYQNVNLNLNTSIAESIYNGDNSPG